MERSSDDIDLTWTTHLWDYVREGSMPSNAEEIYNSVLKYYNSENYWVKWSKICDPGHLKLANELKREGYSEFNFKRLIQQTIGGVFETPFIIGTILSEQNLQNNWPANQENWDEILIEIRKLLESDDERTRPFLTFYQLTI